MSMNIFQNAVDRARSIAFDSALPRRTKLRRITVLRNALQTICDDGNSELPGLTIAYSVTVGRIDEITNCIKETE